MYFRCICLALQTICRNIFSKQNYDIVLQKQIVNLIDQIYDVIRKQKNKISTPDTITLIILQSLVFNLYSKHKNIDTFRLNNSFYMSQTSMQLSQYSMMAGQELQMKKFNAFLIKLLSNKRMFKSLHLLIECKKSNQQRNQLYLTNFFETIQYILNKQKLPKQQLFQMKKYFSQSLNSYSTRKESYQKQIQQVNSVIFTNKLNKIIMLIEQDNIEIIFSLLIILITSSVAQKRKCFQKIGYSGKIICQNIFRNYIRSFNKKSQLFMQSKNPSYIFILNYLYILHLPIIFKFSNFINQCLNISDNFTPNTFYFKSIHLIKNNLKDFIQSLPNQILQLFALLKDIINQHTWKDSIDSLVPIKVLFFNRFLFNVKFSQIFYKEFQQNEYQKLANLVNDLFFIQSLKKHKNKEVHQLIIMINQSFQNTLNYRKQFQDQDSYKFFIQQPLIKYDYELLYHVIKQIQYTPKDQKQYQMITGKLLQQKKFIKIQREQVSAPYKIQKFNSQKQIKPQKGKSALQTNEEIDYDLFKMGLNWESKGKQLQQQKQKLKYLKEKKKQIKINEKQLQKFKSFDKKLKQQVKNSYIKYKMNSLY